ncbi:MAG: DNA methylase, partial [Lachnospiraceae bacterium]|nr:DNA methylase [Lachnospiraceae bacterium]
LKMPTSSTRLIMEAVTELFDRVVDPNLTVRRMNVVANHVVREGKAKPKEEFEQLDLFTDYSALEKERDKEREELEREKRVQQAVITIKNKYGKNAILKGMNLCEGATSIDRNKQIGGHKA